MFIADLSPNGQFEIAAPVWIRSFLDCLQNVEQALIAGPGRLQQVVQAVDLDRLGIEHVEVKDEADQLAESHGSGNDHGTADAPYDHHAGRGGERHRRNIDCPEVQYSQTAPAKIARMLAEAVVFTGMPVEQLDLTDALQIVHQ